MSIMPALIAVLKFIGIAVLVILALIVILLLTVLFVPVRYKLNGSYREKLPRGGATFTWLFHLLRLDILYDEDEIARGRLKLFGFTVYRFGDPEEKSENGRDRGNDEAPSENSKKGGEADKKAAEDNSESDEKASEKNSGGAKESLKKPERGARYDKR